MAKRDIFPLQSLNNANILNNMLEPNSGRTALGTFAPGNQLQPKGHYQRYADRVKFIEEEYTADQILAIAHDPESLGNRSIRDAMIIRHLAMTLQPMVDASNADVRQEREALLDRLEGKANQSVDIQATVSRKELTPEEEAEARDCLLRYALKHSKE